ncbi:hypothetical protein Cylst_1722 [Cylindrospermum stagnale PCC 7417]|uniref:Filamentous hemagglutinin family N-terminal domain protein n=1 Tax=Cylindrospermum stagnale PCC 7417 TaxID=56107 RepID=K9WUU9_9NOST|nr:hypothetical protein [Cylindrospermum stagnale]AFZ23993.1 hypothetical protein Cylst_1722 [Cylindrospermum stagnale PCC 7417]
MNKLWVWVKGISISGAIAFSGNAALANITQDATLPNNSDVATQENIRTVEGRNQSGSNQSRSCNQVSFSNFSLFNFQKAAKFQNNISAITNQTYSTLGDDILKLQNSSYPTDNQVSIGVNKRQFQNLASIITKTDSKIVANDCIRCVLENGEIVCYPCICPC